MNNIVTLSQLISRLAKTTGTDTATARIFLRSFFSSIERQLVEGQTVTIKGIGTFRRSEDPLAGAPEGVMFIPDEALREEVNRRFGVFSPVELADGVDEDDLLASVPPTAPEPEPEPNPEPTPEPTPVPEPVKVPEPAPEPEPAPKSEPAPESEAVTEPTPLHESEEPQIADEATEEEEPSTRGNRLFFWIAALAIIIIGGALWLAIVENPIPKVGEWDDEETMDATDGDSASAPMIEEIPVEALHPETDAKPEVKAAPDPKAEPVAPKVEAKTQPVYETVSANNYLASMARRHYGASIYWVYIYEANKDHLRHPDRIAPGTRVVIPDKSTIPSISNPTEGRRLAEQKAKEIRSRYN